MNLLTLTIETDRLIIKPIDHEYAESIFRSFNKTLTRYMFPKPAGRIEETRKFIDDSLASMIAGTNYQVVIVQKKNLVLKVLSAI